ncbi:MAG: glycoside hydrolase family 3 N-terminal domain-containing protein, partial [Lachnospiraceae bacterium]|nr:glycoside hydrolase family 3 N-terminal domain-containing protein [Lachnospiraceae bacterium]
MLSINMDDVINVISSIKSYLIAAAVLLAAVIICMIAVRKLAKRSKRLIRGEAGVALVAGLCVIANMICTGPMSTLLTSVAGKPVSTINADTTDEATALVEEIVEEGVVLLKDEDGILPVAGGKLNVFGWGSTNPCYGGTGSGALNDAYPTIDLIKGLNDAGIETNTELSKFYTDYKADHPAVGMWAQDWTLPEPNVSLYTDELLSNAKEFSDTAMIVISRVGGEGADLPTDMKAVVDGTYYDSRMMSYDDTLNEGNDWDEGDHFLQMTNREEEMVALVCENFDNVIVVYNGANPFELGFINEYKQIKGALWCAGTGQSGFEGFGRVVSGAVNPSGRLVDTFAYELEEAPTWNNAGYFAYTNMDDFKVEATQFSPETVPTFVNYVEGIYVGYKFYETAAAEGLIDFDKAVQYPFGYGLSYTTFEQKITESVTEGDEISLTVEVKNTGDVAGKDVVEVFYNPPYTNGGIEKASANLVAYDKTGVIEPGASETLTITFATEEMASYDTYGAGAYVLEKGDYIVSINSDSHNVIDSVEVKVAEDVVYGDDNKRESDQVAASNQFADYAEGDVEYLSRADGFANYEKATAAPTVFEMADDAKSTFYSVVNYNAEAAAADEDADAEFPTTGKNAGIKLADMRGVDYNDPQWDTFMDQLTVEEMNGLTSLGGYQTAEIDSVGKYRTNDCDGPASINNNFTGQGSVGFPAAVVIAATWNDDLAHAFGDSIGTMADQMDTAGWYGPAMNIHRTAFAGRNFEYYSEDGVLSGMIAANAIIGAQEHGVYAYMKHFALNDQETNRTSMLCTWSTEQAMREVYLKAFEKAVKVGGSKAVMSSFNYIGNRWAGGSASLLKNVLRDEWGFVGFVETDYFGVYGYMNADQAVRNGTDLMLVNYPTSANDMKYTETAGAQQALRQSAKNILYTVANSRQYTELGIQ